MPITQWGKYKTNFLPRPRILPQIASEATKTKHLFKIMWGKTSRPARKPPSAYRDKGSRASESVVARKKANEDHHRLVLFIRNTREYYSLLSRSHSDRNLVKTKFLRRIREELNYPKNTKLEIVEKKYLELYQRVQNEK